MVTHEHFCARFDEEWKVVGKRDRTKAYELRVVNQGKLNKDYSFKFLLRSLCPQRWRCSFPLGRGSALLIPESHNLLQRRQGRSGDSFCICHLSNSFVLKYSRSHGAVFGAAHLGFCSWESVQNEGMGTAGPLWSPLLTWHRYILYTVAQILIYRLRRSRNITFLEK